MSVYFAAIAENADLFPEYGIVIDADDTYDDDCEEEGVDNDEDGDDDNDEGRDDDDVDRRMKEFKEIAGKSEFSTQELEQMAFTETDKSFDKFKKTVDRNSDQVSFFGAWIMDSLLIAKLINY